MSDSPIKTDLFTIKGDMDDGFTTSMNLTKTADAKVNVIWGEKLLTGEFYRMADEAFINFYCPKCMHSIKISSNRKKIAFDPESGLDVEPFSCCWELGERDNERMDFGIGMCRWSVGISSCVKYIDTNEGKVRIHGIATNAK